MKLPYSFYTNCPDGILLKCPVGYGAKTATSAVCSHIHCKKEDFFIPRSQYGNAMLYFIPQEGSFLFFFSCSNLLFYKWGSPFPQQPSHIHYCETSGIPAGLVSCKDGKFTFPFTSLSELKARVLETYYITWYYIQMYYIQGKNRM